MRTLTLILALCAQLCVPALAFAQQALPTQAELQTGSDLTAVALNDATPANRTVTIKVAKRWSKLRLGIQFTHSAATTVDAQFSCSYDGTTYYRRTTRACSSGTCTLYEQTDSNPVAGDVDFEIEFDVRGCKRVQILLSGTSAGAGDLVTTQSILVVGE